MEKEKAILKNQKIIKACDSVADGLVHIYNHFDGFYQGHTNLEILEISDGDTEWFDDQINHIKEEFIPWELKQCHNKYVSLLKKYRHIADLENYLLLTKKNFKQNEQKKQLQNQRIRP